MAIALPIPFPTQQARGRTLQEVRSLRFESVSLYAMVLVGAVAAALSFIALSAVGAEAGLGRAAFLLPLAVDGFAVAASVGVVRSVTGGERLRERLSEWLGVLGALSLSTLGNIYHALMVGSPVLPVYIKVAFAGSAPVIAAFSIHLYGRAVGKGGIAAHILADDPDTVRADIWQVAGQQGVGSRPGGRFAGSPAETEARRLYDAHVDAHGSRPSAQDIHDAVANLEGAYARPQSTRAQIRDWWNEDARNTEMARNAT